MKRGNLIVVEGSDGSGKKTQVQLLIERAKKEGYKVETLSFPQYNQFWGKVIAHYLKGEFGSLDEINPKDVSVLYAYDRLSAKNQMEYWLSKGKNIILDRYMESNFAHQGGKYKGKDRDEMIKWLQNLEIKQLKLLPSNLVIYLDLPIEWAQKAMKNREREYLKEGEKDLHEESVQHLIDTQEVYRMLAKKNKNWVNIPCLKNNQRISREELAEIIWKIVQPTLVK